MLRTEGWNGTPTQNFIQSDVRHSLPTFRWASEVQQHKSVEMLLMYLCTVLSPPPARCLATKRSLIQEHSERSAELLPGNLQPCTNHLTDNRRHATSPNPASQLPCPVCHIFSKFSRYFENWATRYLAFFVMLNLNRKLNSDILEVFDRIKYVHPVVRRVRVLPLGPLSSGTPCLWISGRQTQ